MGVGAQVLRLQSHPPNACNRPFNRNFSPAPFVIRSELGTALGLLGVALGEGEMGHLIRALDEDRSGTVDRHEFKAFVLGSKVAREMRAAELLRRQLTAIATGVIPRWSRAKSDRDGDHNGFSGGGGGGGGNPLLGGYGGDYGAPVSSSRVIKALRDEDRASKRGCLSLRRVLKILGGLGLLAARCSGNCAREVDRAHTKATDAYNVQWS